MSDPKKKSLKKKIRKVEDELGVDSTVEDIVDGILDFFEADVNSQDSDDSVFQSDDSDDDDFGGGDFGGGGADSDW